MATPPLFVVADGMGGHAAGEVASEIAVTTLANAGMTSPDSDDLARAVIKANHAIIRAAETGEGRAGMGTTCTAALIEGERICIAQVGDSRAYLLHNGRMQQVTRDHSLVAELVEAGQITEEQARNHPQRNIITRALGNDPSTLPDIYEINACEGDRLLLCSDGLYGMVEDLQLEDTLDTVRDPQRCANMLIDQALANGGMDNVTAIVVDISGNSGAKAKRERIKVRAGAFFAVVALVVILLLGGLAFVNLTSNSAYIKINDNQVTIYQGMPGSFLGIQTSHEYAVADIDIDDVPVNVVSQLEGDGVQVDSVQAAEALIETWKSQAESASASASSSDTQATETTEAQTTTSKDEDEA